MDNNVGLDFYIANTKKEILGEESVKFNEVLQGYLQDEEEYFKRFKEKSFKKYREQGPFDLLIGLDQYDDKLFSTQEINQLVNICEGIVIKYKTENLYGQEIKQFAEKLIELCKEALLKNKLIVALGD
ncbi:hypothetical protein I6J18_01590 [Peribacillus psychrosaccharolyticus]|uniref:Uncharacterized protein n=1 Tax=Peribacillus psychrosaccharolyticus TaxID=1407 RepID=A0A974S1U7_PERPY|nr:hypothetical protein [Peribacillus psychrosaccharolyticus]MEC2056156.1 hypothetical protein [Peribacillus psychrosaccharolyticus]MED3745596.1 hypothetical protein [Peribacillus psychrosaccharolyticus]QQT00655.1 hypothetical protein I6J18_01590 [Peribacillus psychrosaccharolyticus]